uniref:Uncharacterized protein n=1 Tax=Arundo donax TaxID=35708 RepID=A0A0A9EY43_ARUDO
MPTLIEGSIFQYTVLICNSFSKWACCIIMDKTRH